MKYAFWAAQTRTCMYCCNKKLVKKCTFVLIVGLSLSALMQTVSSKNTEISLNAFIFTSLQLSLLDMSMKNSVYFEPNVSVFVDITNNNTLIALGGLNLY